MIMSLPLARRSFHPLIISKGSDQQGITSGFAHRSDPGVVRNYATLLFEFAKITPEGLLVVFPSYFYMEMIISMWQGMGVLYQIWQYKLILVETPTPRRLAWHLRPTEPHVRMARVPSCCVARGKVSEGIDFDHHYGCTVLCLGAPYQCTESRILKLVWNS
jgi:DNA excision repair protein ERCC-2